MFGLGNKGNGEASVKMSAAVQIEIQGIPASFVDVPVGDGRPVELALTYIGELAPFARGTMKQGVAILVLPPNIADAIRKSYASEIERQRAAASQAKG